MAPVEPLPGLSEEEVEGVDEEAGTSLMSLHAVARLRAQRVTNSRSSTRQAAEDDGADDDGGGGGGDD